jgi:hypothetical protein
MLAACGPAAQSTAVDPTPTPASLDLTGWTTSVDGVGPQATMKNGRLELSLPWSTHNDQHPNDMIVKLTAPCQLSGDFQITVHYTLKTWPLTNGVWVGIGAPNIALARVSFRTGTDNAYALYAGGTITRVATRDMAGRIRLARVGAALNGYYQDASGGWIQIASAAAPGGALAYSVQAWTDQGFGQRDVVATIDSVDVTGATVSCS